MGWHSFSQKNRSVIRYLLIILVFVLLALGVFLFFKSRIKKMERENEPGVHTEQQN
jgi:flagellar biosynthesis/type III secretory pathway M-ring protein FliF/YscJ